MNLEKEDLERAVSQKILEEKQANALWDFLQKPSQSQTIALSQFNASSVMRYLGAFVILLSMGWLAGVWHEQLGPFGLFWIGLVYGIFFLFTGFRLWQNPLYRTGGGLLLTIAVCMVPLMLYGLEKGWGVWPAPLTGEDWNNGADLQHMRSVNLYAASLELATIIAAACMLYFVRFPFLTAPLWLALWLLSIDSLPLFFSGTTFVEHGFKEISLAVGVVILLLAFIIDRKTNKEGGEDFAFWGYFFGLVAFWGSLTNLVQGTSHWVKAGYCLINILLLFVAVILNRKVFLVFGSLGIFGYLSYLAYTVFADSWLFPLVLSALGIGTLYLGVLYQRHQSTIQQVLQRYGPKKTPPKLK